MKKKSCKEIPAIQWLYMSGKKFCHQRYISIHGDKKKILPKPNRPYTILTEFQTLKFRKFYIYSWKFEEENLFPFELHFMSTKCEIRRN